MKPVTEIQISVVQRDKNICYQTCRKTHKKPSLQVFELGVTVLKKKEDEPRCSTEWRFGSDERGYDIAVFRSILCLSHTDCLHTSTKNTPVVNFNHCAVCFQSFSEHRLQEYSKCCAYQTF